MDFLASFSNKFFHHLLAPFQPYFKYRLQEAQIDVKPNSISIKDITFSPEALNEHLKNSPVIISSIWIYMIELVGYKQFSVKSPQICLKLNPDYQPAPGESNITMAELAKSSIQVSEEVMKENLAEYLNSSKSTGSEVMRRFINMLLHRLCVDVTNVSVCLEIPNCENPAKMFVLRVTIDQIQFSDSSKISSTDALELSYSRMNTFAEQKSFSFSNFSVDLMEVDSTYNLTNVMNHKQPSEKYSILSLPGTTKVDMILHNNPFKLDFSVLVENIYAGFESCQFHQLAIVTQAVNQVLSKKASPETKPNSSTTAGLQRSLSDSHSSNQSNGNKKSSEIPKTGKPEVASDTGLGPTLYRALPDEDNDEDDEDSFKDATDDENDDNVGEQDEVIEAEEAGNDIDQSLAPSAAFGLESSMGVSRVSLDGNLLLNVKVKVNYIQASVILSNENNSVQTSGFFDLHTLKSPELSQRNFLLLRMSDLVVKSTTSRQVGGGMDHKIKIGGLTIFERYKLSSDHAAPSEQAPSQLPPPHLYYGDQETDTYISFPFLILSLPHGHTKKSKQQNSSLSSLNTTPNILITSPPTSPRPSNNSGSAQDSVDYSLKIAQTKEKSGTILKLWWRQISITCPFYGLPIITRDTIDCIESALSIFDSQPIKNESSLTGYLHPEQDLSASNQAPTGSNSIVQPISVIPERRPKVRNAIGLLESSSGSSGAAAMEYTKSRTKDDTSWRSSEIKITEEYGDEEEAEHESPHYTPNQNSIFSLKGDHLFISVRFPSNNLEETSHYDYPVYRPDFLAIHVSQPSIKLLSTIPPSDVQQTSVEFHQISVYLHSQVEPFDYTLIAHEVPGKRPSAYQISPFLSIEASSSNTMDVAPESIIIETRKLPGIPMDTHGLNHKPTDSRYLLEHYRLAESHESFPMTSSLSPPVVRPMDFSKAPFSSIQSSFEGQDVKYSSMDFESWNQFRNMAKQNAQVSITLTVHFLSLEVHKKQMDLILELLDSQAPKEYSVRSRNKIQAESQDPKLQQQSQSLNQAMTPLIIDLRMNGANFNLKCNSNMDYFFNNVQDIQVLQAGRYLNTDHSFLVAQVSSARLPHRPELLNSSCTIEKIPDKNPLEPTPMLTTILSTKPKNSPNLLNPSKSHLKPQFERAILVEINNTVADFTIGETWVKDLSGFFVRDVPFDPSLPTIETELYVNASNSSISLSGNPEDKNSGDADDDDKWDYGQQQCFIPEPKVVLHLGKFVTSSLLYLPLNPEENIHHKFNMRMANVQLFMAEDQFAVREQARWNPGMSTFRDYWISRDYEPSGVIKYLIGSLEMNSKQFPKMQIDFEIDAILDMTGDMFLTLKTWLAAISRDPPEARSVRDRRRSRSRSGISSRSSRSGSTGSGGSWSGRPRSFSGGKSSFSSLNRISSSPVNIGTFPSPRLAHDRNSSHQLSVSPFSHALKVPQIQEDDDEEELMISIPLSHQHHSQPPNIPDGVYPSTSIAVGNPPINPNNNDDDSLEYVVLQLANQKQKEEYEALMDNVRRAGQASNLPSARFLPSASPKEAMNGPNLINSLSSSPSSSSSSPSLPIQRESSSGRLMMPKIIENYRPEPKSSPPPRENFKLSIHAKQFTFSIRDGNAWNEPGSEQTGELRICHDLFSASPSKHLNLLMRDMELKFAVDDMKQSELEVKIRSLKGLQTPEATFGQNQPQQQLQPSHSTVFLDFDPSGNSFTPNALTLIYNQSLYYENERIDNLHNTALLNSPLFKPTLKSTFKFNLLPLVINVDYPTSDLLVRFWSMSSPPQQPVAPSTPEYPQKKSSSTASSSMAIQSQDSSLYNLSSSSNASGSSSTSQETILHNVSIGPISLRIKAAGADVVIILPSIYSRDVPGFSALGSQLSYEYFPRLLSAIFKGAGTLPVVRLVLTVVGSVSSLIINPYSEYTSGRSALGGAFSALGTGAHNVASELLNFGIWITSGTGSGLEYLTSFWNSLPGAPKKPANASVTSLPITGIRDGAQAGYNHVAKELTSAGDCLVVVPWNEYKKSKSIPNAATLFMAAVPVVVLKPVIGVAHGLSKVMEGASQALNDGSSHHRPRPGASTSAAASASSRR